MLNAQIATLAVGLISIGEGASLFWPVLAIIIGMMVGRWSWGSTPRRACRSVRCAG